MNKKQIMKALKVLKKILNRKFKAMKFKSRCAQFNFQTDTTNVAVFCTTEIENVK